MKKLIISCFALVLAAGTVLADDKEVTLTGEGKCAKCALKEADSCQNVIVVEKDGKKTTYYIAQNDISKAFHKNICSETKKITAKGTVKEADGKKQLTASKLELAK